jgi:hypothetical protein
LLGLRTAVYHIDDLDKARTWFTELVGHAPYFDEPYYIGFNVGGYELGLLPDQDGVGAYWGVDDIESEVARLVGLGDIKTASLIDPFGNEIGVIENPNFNIP